MMDINQMLHLLILFTISITLLVILSIIKLYFRNNIFKKKTRSFWLPLGKLPLGKFYCSYFNDILIEFCLVGVSMDRYQIWWLLSSGKVVGVWRRDTFSWDLDFSNGRGTKHMKIVEVIESIVGIWRVSG